MRKFILGIAVMLFMASCGRDTLPEAVPTSHEVAIYPDYKDVTVPANIAPLNFCLQDSVEGVVRLSCGNNSFVYDAENGSFHIDEDEWSKLLLLKGDIKVTVCTKKENGEWQQHPDFAIHVSADSIEPYVVYRRIVPGYHKWNKMGIYQRSLEGFSETALIENTQTENSCVNCHTFRKGDASTMVFHQRVVNPGTFLVSDYGKTMSKIEPGVQPGALQGMVYPAWHPSGKYIAFSSNKTLQDMHLNDSNRIEVYDTKSSVQIYDVRRNILYTTPVLGDTTKFNTFPTFTPDGKHIVFCSADSVAMPDHFREVRYNIISADFIEETGQVGDSVTILYNASSNGKSAVLPRFSPDGSKLLFTEADYGTFPIWHHEADLRMLDMQSHAIDSLAVVNSCDTESFHSWSQSGRWILFSSRREDGLFTRLYITHVDKDGKASKPFLLPQKDANDNKLLMQSYNVPELVDDEISPLPVK